MYSCIKIWLIYTFVIFHTTPRKSVFMIRFRSHEKKIDDDDDDDDDILDC